MQIWTSRTAPPSANKRAIALGAFDGLHIGHMSLLKALHEAGEGMEKGAFTFVYPPALYFGTIQGALFTWEEKEQAFREADLDFLCAESFDREFANIAPEDFLSCLEQDLNAGLIVVGFDYRFGHKGRGDIPLLQDFCDRKGIRLVVCDPVVCDGQPVSSTRIRELLSHGKPEEAARLLGRPYMFTGLVESGKHLGKIIGFPTANLKVAEHKMLPPFGVYAVKVLTSEGEAYGVANLGRKPTVQQTTICNLETHLFDFQKDLYGQPITVEMLHFIRPEQKFEDVEHLRSAIVRDAQTARQFFGI